MQCLTITSYVFEPSSNAPTNVSVKDIGSWASMVLQSYQNFIEMTSNMIYIVAFGGGLKIHFNTEWVEGQILADQLTLSN